MGIRKKTISAAEYNGPRKLPKGSQTNFHYKSKRGKRKKSK